MGMLAAVGFILSILAANYLTTRFGFIPVAGAGPVAALDAVGVHASACPLRDASNSSESMTWDACARSRSLRLLTSWPITRAT